MKNVEQNMLFLVVFYFKNVKFVHKFFFMYEFMCEFVCEFVKEVLMNFLHEFITKFIRIRMNCSPEKLIMLRMATKFFSFFQLLCLHWALFLFSKVLQKRNNPIL